MLVIIDMYQITLFRAMNPHQRCLHAKVKNRNELKQVKSEGVDVRFNISLCLIKKHNFLEL